MMQEKLPYGFLVPKCLVRWWDHRRCPGVSYFTIVVEYQYLKLEYVPSGWSSVQRYLVNPKGKQQVRQSFELLKVPVQKSVVFISILLDRDRPC